MQPVHATSETTDGAAPEAGPLQGEIARQIRMGRHVSASGGDDEFAGIPAHVRKLKEENPGQVAIMEWVPTKHFDPVNAQNLAALVGWIHREFVALLHTQKRGVTDEQLRARMRTNTTINNFADKYEHVWKNVTTRDVATNPALMTPILFQLHCLQQIERGHITEEQAKAMVADCAMNSMIKEAVRQGKLAPADIPNPADLPPQDR